VSAGAVLLGQQAPRVPFVDLIEDRIVEVETHASIKISEPVVLKKGADYV